MGKKLIVVDHNGKGDYYYIQDALNAISKDNAGVMILVKEGVYYEKLIINKPNVTLVGEPGKDVTLIFDDQKSLNDSGRTRYSTASVWITADDFSAENLIFANSAETKDMSTEAATICINGDRAQFHHCGFIGRYGTVVTVPKPLRAVSDEGALDVSRQYFRCCYFEGDVNFLLGNSAAVFEFCKIHSLDRFGNETNYLTLPSVPTDENCRYVFKHCILTGEGPSQSTYLGKGMNHSPKVALMDCRVGEHLHGNGWENGIFAEHGTLDMNNKPLEKFEASRVLTGDELSPYTLENIFTDASWCIGTPEYQLKASSRAS